MTSYFVDSGYWIALENADDQNHLHALSHWQELITNMPQLVTTSYVFDEVITLKDDYISLKDLKARR
jgi:uncharacterized protein